MLFEALSCYQASKRANDFASKVKICHSLPEDDSAINESGRPSLSSFEASANNDDIESIETVSSKKESLRIYERITIALCCNNDIEVS